MTRRVTWIVGEEDVGERVDVVLGRRLPQLSRRAARALGLRGRIRIADQRVPPSHVVALGDVVSITVGEDPIDLETPLVLAQSDDFVYVHKPSGLHTHRLGADDPPALACQVARVFPECAGAGADAREGGAIARLDRDTSGVVAFARHPAAWKLGRAAMVDPRTRKHYVAVAVGLPARPWPPARLEAAAVPNDPPWWRAWPELPQPQSTTPVRLMLSLGRGADRQRVAVRPDGRVTSTTLAPLGTSAEPCRTVFAVALGRGFRHQIRVALAWLGLPIAGDLRYGIADSSVPRLLLHCAEIDLSACCAGEQRVRAPLWSGDDPGPNDLGAYLRTRVWHAWSPDDRAC